jgi:hypothetical protein
VSKAVNGRQAKITGQAPVKYASHLMGQAKGQEEEKKILKAVGIIFIWENAFCMHYH